MENEPFAERWKFFWTKSKANKLNGDREKISCCTDEIQFLSLVFFSMLLPFVENDCPKCRTPKLNAHNNSSPSKRKSAYDNLFFLNTYDRCTMSGAEICTNWIVFWIFFFLHIGAHLFDWHILSTNWRKKNAHTNAHSCTHNQCHWTKSSGFSWLIEGQRKRYWNSWKHHKCVAQIRYILIDQKVKTSNCLSYLKS